MEACILRQGKLSLKIGTKEMSNLQKNNDFVELKYYIIIEMSSKISMKIGRNKNFNWCVNLGLFDIILTKYMF